MLGVIDVLNIAPDGGSFDWSTVPQVGESVEGVVLEVVNDTKYALTRQRRFWSLREEWNRYAATVEIGGIVSVVIESHGLVDLGGPFRGRVIGFDRWDRTLNGRSVRCQIVGLDHRNLRVLITRVGEGDEP